MPIRDATYADLVPGSKILAAAFKDESLFGAFFHPHQDKYPNDMYLYFLRWLRPAYLNGANQHLIVSYKNDSSGREECVTGIALWLKQDSKAPEPSLYAKAIDKAINAYQYLEEYVYPNRALSLVGRTSFQAWNVSQSIIGRAVGQITGCCCYLE